MGMGPQLAWIDTGLVHGAPKDASFKVSGGLRFGELDAVVWIWLAENYASCLMACSKLSCKLPELSAAECFQ